MAPPAAAAGVYACTDYQKKEFDTSGYNTDISVRLCVYQEQSTSSTKRYQATAVFSWQDGAGLKKFNNLDMSLRLEKSDRAIATATCDYTSKVNSVEGDYVICRTAWVNGSVNKMSADGGVYYDIADDGEGSALWDLGGTAWR
ncbi:hypothetical protein ACFQ7B_37195 [Streptomyces erythrochromogenes]|uniref:hypothetical protein n=1 Tax=Streptomyces erythrochromogenes TaxID=285574 RepID=UPI00368CBE3F